MQQQIAQTEYHHQAHLHIRRDITPTQGTILDLLLGIVTGTGTGITGPYPSHIHTITKATVRIAHTHTEATSDHTTDALTEALYITITQALIITAATCHTEGRPHTEAHPLPPGIAADLEYILHTN